jgi:signal transduction histidine kinase
MPYGEITDAERLRELVDAVLLIGSDLDLPTVLRRIVDAARSLVDATYAALGVLDEQKHGLEDFITVGLSPEGVRAIGHLPEGLGVLGLLIVDPKPVRIADITTHEQSAGFPPGHPPMKSFLGVPVLVRGEVFGNLYLTDKRGADEFSPEDESLVVALAIAAGVAIENARLHARVRDLALLEDRERIARDLHDTVIQRLFATGLNLQACYRLAQLPAVQSRLRQAVDDLDETIRQIRTTIFALETTTAEDAGLRANILELAREMASVLGFDPRIRFDGPVDTAVDPHVAEHLLSALREALANVARHAHASSVEIDVVVVAGDVVLRVTDNGVGVPPAVDRRAGGHGLRNLAGRAAEMAGTFSLERRAEGGTELTWIVPAS